MSLPPPQLEESWKNALGEEWSKPYLSQLVNFLAKERALNTPIYPPKQEVFAAFNETPFDKVKVVIIGQDPYHGPNQAHGLSFSVKQGITPPPSLQNIFKELRDDLGIPFPKHGCLTKWTKQGVLLLNAVLTVRQNEPGSHHKKGWECFTDAVVAKLATRKDPVIFVLWGKSAQEKCQPILYPNNPNANSSGCLGITHAKQDHPILTAPHPSPYSAHMGFLGCRHFSKINELLIKLGKQAIDWSLD